MREYKGKGECVNCGGAMGRWRDHTRLITGDRCKACGAEWIKADHTTEWVPAEMFVGGKARAAVRHGRRA